MHRTLLALLMLLPLACSSEPTPPDASTPHCDPCGTPVDAATAPADAAVLALDASSLAPDASLSPDAAIAADASLAPDASEVTCSFNSDCPSNERCECDEATGCFCRPGTRGTGQAGVDPCKDGNDCASSLCVEGNGGFYCSGECVDATQCGPQLPKCTDVAFVGRICVRVSPDGGM